MNTPTGRTPRGAVIAAALALPGVLPGAAQAQVTAPNTTLVQFKYLYYKDYQDSGDRMTVKSPALYLLAPLTDDWVFEIGAVYDSISGASPYYHTTLSGASGQGIRDGRAAGDLTITKYFANRTSVALRGAYSTEDDYSSAAGGLTIRHATPDQNTTFTIGGGYSSDKVFPSVGTPTTYHKHTYDAIVGVSQVFTPNDTAQLNFYYAHQSGYLTDPYKAYWGVDNRPITRDQYAALLRWNHYFESADATLRSSYRYYHDDWEVTANTLTFEWAQTLRDGWVLTPGLRYTTQSAAYFYYDPIYDPLLGAPFPPGYLQNPNGILLRGPAAVRIRRNHRGFEGIQGAAGRLADRRQGRVLRATCRLAGRWRRQSGPGELQGTDVSGRRRAQVLTPGPDHR